MDASNLSQIGWPILYTLFLWWFSTGAILFLDGLPRSTYRWSLLGATGVLLLSLAVLHETRSLTNATGAYVAFTSAIGVWAWNEMAFLMGLLTGPRREACPRPCGGLRHFGHALSAILYHELALLASGIVVLVLVWGGSNPVGAWTYGILWAMRLSAKLNVFLGVPNLTVEFLPDSLSYLERYFRREPMNLFFPLSVSVATVATLLFVQKAQASDADSFERLGSALAATLLGLGLLEHWLLVLPLPAAALWGWGLRSRQPSGGADS